jgi:hypothetical protein
MKLGKNASDTCAVLSEAYGGEATKKSSVSEHKWFKEGLKSKDDVKITIEDCSSLSSISRVLFTLNSFHKAKQSTKLINWNC